MTNLSNTKLLLVLLINLLVSFSVFWFLNTQIEKDRYCQWGGTTNPFFSQPARMDFVVASLNSTSTNEFGARVDYRYTNYPVDIRYCLDS